MNPLVITVRKNTVKCPLCGARLWEIVLDLDTKSRAWAPRWVDVTRPSITRANPDDRCRCGRR